MDATQFGKRTFGLSEESECCLNCKHYLHHWVKDRFGYVIPTCVGHCVYPRQKSRRVFDCCENFRRGRYGDEE